MKVIIFGGDGNDRLDNNGGDLSWREFQRKFPENYKTCYELP